MSYECPECEHDIRGGHAPECSRYEPALDPAKPPREMLGADHRKKFDEAMARLDAEVAAHEGDDEPTLTIVNATGQEFTYRVTAEPPDDLDPDTAANGIDATTGLSLGGAIVGPASPTGKARFGDRLRATGWQKAFVEPVAAAIDHDADLQRTANLRFGAAVYRRRVEEAVERGRYSVLTTAPSVISGMIGETTGQKDVLDAEPFLEALGTIFGERPAREARSLTHFLRDVQELEPASPEAEDSIIISVGDLEIIAERYLSEPYVPAGAREMAEVPLALHAEHEPAHDRRERESARHEDSTGRVEGVDR